ncbi:hypothetical protein [Chitinophaga sancti]|uniref:hypothetical protein n=1 Tax=Chitinophaga sancti TaxID=1004 RepID=UPI003F796AA7
MRITLRSIALFLAFILFSCKHINQPSYAGDYSYKLDSISTKLAALNWANSVHKDESILRDTSIVLPEEVLSKERVKLNMEIYEDSADWYEPGPAVYHFVMREEKIKNDKIKLEGQVDDGIATIIATNYILPSGGLPVNAEFEGDSVATVSNIRFNKPADFSANYMKHAISFFECDFQDKVLSQSLAYNPIFRDCIFYKGFQIGKWYNNNDDAVNPDIRNQHSIQLHHHLIFNSCILKGNFAINGVRFDSVSTIVFDQTHLPDTLDLTNLSVQRPIDFTKALPNIDGHKCQLVLTNFDGKLIMDYRPFHLYIPSSITSREEFRDKNSSIYQKLLNQFKENGFLDSYEKLDIEYNEWKSQFDWTLVLSDYWWKFGYQKWRILIYSLIFILIFSVINYIYYENLQKVYPIEKLKRNNFLYTRYSLIRFGQRIFISVIYTSLIFFRFGIDYKNATFSPMRYVFLIVFQYTIGLICTGFLLNWIIKG